MNVLDSTAMLALLLKEDGADVVRDALRDHTRPCVAHGLNLCEVYYHFLRTDDVATTDEAIQTLLDAGVRVQEQMDEAFWKDVGFLKATYPPMSLADAVCLATARRLNAEVLTSDHHELDKIAALGVLPIVFIR
jgi:PIN domain nuclease of toxin-antitoxin system